MKLVVWIAALFAVAGAAYAQQQPSAAPTPASVPSPAAAPTTPVDSDPIVTQIRKSVVFIKLLCKLNDKEFDVRGTGFFMFYPDERLGKDQGFLYLVTNRHVALCINDDGVSMEVETIGLTMNRREAQNGSFMEAGPLVTQGNVGWTVPEDQSVDLAVLPFRPDQTRFDYKSLSVNMLLTHDLIVQNGISEGETVFFAGFFYQFAGVTRMEPIVRQGIVAMMPQDRVPFVGSPESVYLADVHAFGGNSGSPAFINMCGFHRGGMALCQDYRLLGVVNGGISEDENFNLQLASTIKGHGIANSGISTIVPADKLRDLLNGPKLLGMRDAVVAARAAAHK